MPADAVALADVYDRLERLEAETRIRALVATYFEVCEQLDAPGAREALQALFTADATWRGRGTRYAAAFGVHEGREAIVAMLGSYAGPPPHFALNAHFLGNERITVDGPRAAGRWLMVQTATYTAGGSDLRAAALRLEFERLAEGWRIRVFETENVFSRGVEAWNDQTPIPLPEA